MTAPLLAYPLRNWEEAGPKNGQPAIPFKIEDLGHNLQQCYQATTQGKFADAIVKFREVLLSCALLVTESKQEALEAEQLAKICREYLVGLLMETTRKLLSPSSADNKKRTMEMAIYFTHCELQPRHQLLTLKTAVFLAYKTGLKVTCQSLCRRNLELCPPPEQAAKIRQILSACEQANTNDYEVSEKEA